MRNYEFPDGIIIKVPGSPAEGRYMKVASKIRASDSADAAAALARRIYNARRIRGHFLGPGLLGEPAWDILLDLFASAREGKRISVSSACLAASVPATTALRYIDRMCADGLLRRVPSTEDGRISYVEMTEEGDLKMAAFLAAISGL